MLSKITHFIRRKKIILIAVLVVTFGFGIYRLIKSPSAEVQFQTTPVEKGLITSSVSASGQVLSVNVMSANTKASGIVKEVYVQDGDYVNEGDKILEIELDFQGKQKMASAWSSYLSAKNSLESAKTSLYTLQSDMLSKWDSFKELAESDYYEDVNSANRNLPEFYIAQDNWLASEAKYKAQQSVIDQAEIALNNSWLSYKQSSSTITSPTSGTITSLMYTEGMSIGSLDTGSSESNQKVATIQTEGMPIISVNLSEIDVSQVELDQQVIISLDSISDKTFTGRIAGVDRIGTTTNGVTQYESIIRFDSSSSEILPNMTGTAEIVIDRKNDVLIVSSSAIQTQDGQSYANVLVDGESQLVPVEIGLTSDTQTEIISGLNEGDLVITGTISLTESQSNGTSIFGGGGGMMVMPR